MYNEEYMDELYHHGIFGQRWGKRNGPPYPLKPSKHSRAEKKAGWRKSLKNKNEEETPEEETKRIQSQISDFQHPDKKFMDSRKFGSDDLGRLTQKFNNEKAFNDALAAKLRSENMLNEEMFKNMSRKQKKELYKKMSEMEFNTAYNNAVRSSIDSQINLLRSQQTLRQLTAKPPGKMQKFKRATGEVLADIGKKSIKNVGGQVAAYYLGTAINQATKKNIVDVKKKNEGSKKNNKNDDNN